MIGGKWAQGVTVRTDAKGRATYVAPVVKGGAGKVRTVTKVGRTTVVSAPVAMTAYRWVDLDPEDGLSTSDNVFGAVTRNGKAELGWSAVLSSRSDEESIGMTGWPLDGACTTLRGRAFSETPGAWFFVVAGKDVDSGTRVSVDSDRERPFTADIRGAKMVFIAAGIDDGVGVVSVAKPQIRCPWR